MSAKKKHEEHENHERWLVSYADFITLLFAFFVVMYATSNSDLEKQKQFEESVRTELKISAGAGGGAGGGKELGGDIVPELVNPVDNFPRRGGPDEVRDYVERQLQRHLTKEERQQYIQEVRSDALGARVTLAGSAFFPSGETKLLKSSLEVLDRVAEILKKTDRKVMIEGHTDNQPIASAQFPSNWELAGARAASVVRYLIKYKAFEGARLGAISYADQRPRVENDTEENRNKNRRIEILITNNQPE